MTPVKAQASSRVNVDSNEERVGRTEAGRKGGIDVKKLLGAILITGTTILGGVQVAQAGSATDAALGLGAFAVFNQFVRGETIFHSLFQPAAPVVVQQPVIVAPPPPVYMVPPPQVVYVPPPRPVYYAPPPPVVYAPAPAHVYYAPTPVPPGRYKVPPGHYKKVHPHWKKQYRQYRPY
jgi:hypothetical protein